MRTRVCATVPALAVALVVAARPARAEVTQCTAITTVPYVISTQGVYCLTDDLKVGLQTGVAIEIAANNVVLDFNGHRLSNSHGAATLASGVHASSRQNLDVRNGVIKGFYAAVNLQSVQTAIVERIHADQSWHTGIGVNGEAIVVRDNVVLLTGGTTALGADSDSFAISVAGDANSILGNDVAAVTGQGVGHGNGIVFTGGVGNLAVANRITQATRGIMSDTVIGVKYRDTLTSGITLAAYVGGTDAGNNH